MVARNEEQNSRHDRPESGHGSECGNGLERVYPLTVVRYGVMNYVGEFTHRSDMVFACGKQVVVQTHRGIELGTQVSLSCRGCSKAVTREHIAEYVKKSGPESLRLNAGRILREGSTDDIMENKKLAALVPGQMAFCTDAVNRKNLPMKLVTCENILGGERIIFYFMADGRVDFRELVKDLAHEFQTRIEMRQIGARDEARILADYETCGRECCCKNFLKSLKPISMKMAKLQKATLAPSKVSGRCGRLKCCLRFEHESYEDLEKRLPRIGSRIRTAHGTGTVVDRQILTQLVQFHADDGKLLTVVAEDILEQGLGKPPTDDNLEPHLQNDGTEKSQ